MKSYFDMLSLSRRISRSAAITIRLSRHAIPLLLAVTLTAACAPVRQGRLTATTMADQQREIRVKSLRADYHGTSGAPPLGSMTPNGHFTVEFGHGDRWQTAGDVKFDQYVRNQSLQLPAITSTSTEIRIRLTKTGGGAAHLDTVTLDGRPPVRMADASELALKKLADKDFDLIDASQPVELTFAPPIGTLTIAGRIEAAVSGANAFMIPRQNYCKDLSGSEATYLPYRLDAEQSAGKPAIADLEKNPPFIHEFLRSGSGHPSEYLTGWVRNDRDNLYVTLDFAGDNTLDGNKDFAKVFTRSGDQLREFKLTETDSTWGKALFTYTAAAPWQHKLYEFTIPLSELEVKDRSLPLQLAFSTYGTCSPGDLSKSGPELAYDPVNNRYLSVYKVRPDVQLGACKTRIVGQLRNFDGSANSPEFTIAPEFDLSSSSVGLAVQYDSINKRFLVVWNNDLGNLVGQLVNPDGSLNGTVQFISNSSQVNSPTLGLAFDPGNNRFLTVWQDRRNITTSDADIYGQLLNTDLTPFFPADTAVNFAITTAAGLQHKPKVSFEPISGRYLVVWQDFGTATDQIKGQLVNAGDGTLIATPFLIADNNQFNPDIATDSVNNRFLVAWQDGFTGGNAPHASIVGSNGTVAPFVTINPTGGTGTAPRLAFSATDQQFLATWQATTPTLAQRIAATDGTSLAGTEITILATTGNAPTTAYNAVCNNFLVAVEDTTTNPTTIFYQTDGGVCPGDTTPPTDGTLAVTSIDTTRIDLAWSGFTDAVSGLAATNTYTLVRGDGTTPPADCSGTPIYQGSATSFSDTGLAAASPYAYRLCATDAAKNISAGVTVSAQTLNPCLAAPPDIVSWWPAAGGAGDIVGGNSGTMANPASLTLGKVGQGFAFDGVNDYLRMAASATLNVGTGNGFTLGAWIMPKDVSTQQPLFEWSNGATGVHFWIAVPSPGTGAGSLYANVADTTGAGHVIASPPGILTANSYQYVVLTYDKVTGQAALFLNGTSVAAQNLGIFTPRTDLNLFIGNRPGILKFTGAMDELQLYNRALTPAEILSTYNGGNGGLCTTPDIFPPVDGTLTATASSSSQLYLYWSGFSDAGSGLATTNPYKLVRADGTTSAPADCATGTVVYQGSSTAAYDTPLTPNTPYAYRLCATDSAGNVSTGATATATTPQIFTLSTATAGSGGASGTVSPASGSFDAGSYTYLYAYPDASSVFDFWSGDCSGTYSSIYVYFDSNKSCTANFAPLPAPQVTAALPADGSVIEDVTTTTISAEFNVPLNQTSIAAATFAVKDQAGTAVAGTLTYDNYYKQVTFTPTAPLAGGTTYTVTVTTGIKNAIDTPMAADYSWSFTTTPCLGGVATEGNLLITPLADGRIGVYRYLTGSWQEQIFSWDSKGSRLQIGETGTLLGYFGTGTTPTPVASSQLSSTQTKTEWLAGNVRIIQELTYQPGAAYYGLNWKIVNESLLDLSDLRFFHGEDTYFLGVDRGAGFWDAPNNTVGVQRTYGADLQRMSLQAITAPYAYDSEYYGTVSTNVGGGALTNTIDPSESTDNGYALEWRTATLAAGTTWTISAFEKFADVPVGAVFVTAPVTTSCDAGGTCTLTYTVTNTTTTVANITLTLTPDQAGWTASTASTSLAVAAGGSQQVTVQLAIPSGIADGFIGHLTLNANDGTVTASDTAAIHVQNLLGSFSLSALTSGAGAGTVALSPASGPYLAGTVVQLTAAPATGSVFAGWSGDCSGATNPYSLTMDAAKSCTATFTPMVFNVTFAADTNGSLNGTVAQSVDYNGSATAVTAVPTTGYHLVNWTGTGGFSSVSNPLIVSNVTQDMALTANFAPDPINGVCGVAHGAVFMTAPATNLCTVGTASALSGTGPWSWTCSGNFGGAPAACSALIQQWTVTLPTDGTIVGPSKVNHGSSATYQIVPLVGYRITDIQVDSVSVGAVTSYTVNNISSDHTITATFAVIAYTARATSGANGSITPTGDITLNHGASQSYTITPDSGYVIQQVKVDDVTIDRTSVGTTTGKIYTFTFNNVGADHTIAAYFAADGIIDPNNTTGVPTLSDALLVLAVAIGDRTVTDAEKRHIDITPLPQGLSTPDGKVDISDALLSLRRLVGLVLW